MKIGLFWKITAGFWLTLIGITQGVWLLVVLTNPAARGGQTGLIRRYVVTEITSPSLALRLGGRQARDEMLRTMAPEDRRRFAIIAAGSAPPSPIVVTHQAGARTWQATTTVVGPDQSWRIDYRLKANGPTPPAQVWGPAVLGGFLFSAILAWYLTRPIQRLRTGFERLAKGDMTVRLRPAMGRRRDEIADLGRDFDLMAERLQQLVGARDQLLHDVSHELRSPLARLQTAIGLARQRPERIEAAMERIELESGRLDQLVGELLTLSRAEGAAPRHDQYLDVVELLRTVVADARFEAAPREIRVELWVGPPAASADPRATVRGNAELLRRGLENVVRNALRFSNPGQTVTIEVRLEPERRSVLIEVADQGPGVPPDGLDVMFDPFVRLDDARRAEGFGLGLAIARRATLSHGGEISAANGEAGGLVVRIRLPLETTA